MYWRCKCGHKNPENARACGKCHSTENARKQFYIGALVAASLVFFLVYAVGVSVGGTLVVFSIKPTNGEILDEAKALGMKTEYNEELKSIFDLKPKQKEEAEAKALEKARASMSVLVRNILYWVIPFFLFPLFGAIIGFSTAGRTIIEAAIGSAIGQGLGFVFIRFGTNTAISYLELGIGVVVAFAIVAAGAYVGEAVQEKKERASLDETRDSEFGVQPAN
jgi:cation transport ATPase